jgi:hypothetical protein
MANRAQFSFTELRDAQSNTIFRPLLSLQLEYRNQTVEARVCRIQARM